MQIHLPNLHHGHQIYYFPMTANMNVYTDLHIFFKKTIRYSYFNLGFLQYCFILRWSICLIDDLVVFPISKKHLSKSNNRRRRRYEENLASNSVPGEHIAWIFKLFFEQRYPHADITFVMFWLCANCTKKFIDTNIT